MQDESIRELLRTVLLSHGAETGRGLPLGNITSQLFANVYLHELDWFMKQELRVNYYARYCDDFVVVARDSDYLHSLIGPIETYLREALRLELHPHKVSIRAWDQGIDFLGYVVKPHAVLLRTKTRRRMLARVNADNVSSYLGLCSHADAYRLQQIIKTKVWTPETRV